MIKHPQSNKLKHRFSKISPLLFASIGALLSYSKAFGESRDFQGYWKYFDNMELSSSCLNETSDAFEIGFHVSVCFLAPIFRSADTLMTVFVFFSLFVKLSILYLIASNVKTSENSFNQCFILSIALYFSRFFPLHELTQIRISLGISFMFLGVFALLSIGDSSIENRFIPKSLNYLSLRIKSILYYSIVAAIFYIACLFHNSCILAIPLFFAAYFVKKTKDIIIFSLSFGIFMKIFIINYAIPVAITITPRFGEYLFDPAYAVIQLFSITRILDIFFACIAFYLFDEKNKYQTYFTSLWIFSIISFYSLADVPAMAYRFSEMIQVFGILLIVVMRSKQQPLLVTPWVVVTILISVYGNSKILGN